AAAPAFRQGGGVRPSAARVAQRGRPRCAALGDGRGACDDAPDQGRAACNVRRAPPDRLRARGTAQGSAAGRQGRPRGVRNRFAATRRDRRTGAVSRGGAARGVSRQGSRRGAGPVKIRAQIGMVLNLDKCIGCHTCSVTCKNVWTSRPGVEYAWFNNVESKLGVGYPKDWENQDRWNGGWV